MGKQNQISTTEALLPRCRELEQDDMYAKKEKDGEIKRERQRGGGRERERRGRGESYTSILPSVKQ
jgi:hypothetical protein